MDYGTVELYRRPEGPAKPQGELAGVNESAPANWASPALYNTNMNPNLGKTSGLPIQGLLGAVLTGVGAIGSMGSGGTYDPEKRALKRFYELTDPNSAHFKRIRAYYGKILSDSGPTADALYGLAKSGGVGAASASSLAYRQGMAQAGQNREKVSQMVERDVMNSEQMAQGYLGLEYQRAKDEQENSGGFFDQLLGLGGGLLSKVV